MIAHRLVFATALGTALVACAPIPPPDTVRDLEPLPKAPAVVEASPIAPAARAHADELARQARVALAGWDYAGASILAEQARVAFDGVVVEARLVRAEERRAREEARAASHAQELAALDGENQRLTADIAALERRIDALEVSRELAVDGKPRADIARERMTQALTSIRFDARVLCTAAGLLAPAGGAATTALAKANEALSALDRTPMPPDHDALRNAQVALANCRTLLEGLRSTVADGTPNAGSAARAAESTLAADLATRGFDVIADVRGTAVRLFGPKAPSALSKGDFEALLSLATRAATPMLLVTQGDAASVASAMTPDAVKALLQPLTSRRLAANERLEIVFVTQTIGMR